MLFAAIDIGSNAARLLFSNVYERDGQIIISKASLTRVPTRLGLDVYTTKTISKERAAYFVKTMKAFSLLIDVYQPAMLRVCATAAMREAKNSAKIIEKVKNKTGLKIRTINGQQEAELIRKGVQAISPSAHATNLFIDVGGGSTELSIEQNGKLICQKSFKVGTLRLLSGKTKDSVWREMTGWLSETPININDLQVIGTGGNINRLQKIFGDFSAKTLSFDHLAAAYQNLKKMSVEERIEQFGFRPDRADVIVPAAYIYLFIMQKIKANGIFVPKVGLADGLILQQYQEYQNLTNHKK